MTYPKLQLVTAPTADALILYDFSDRGDEHTAERKPLREGFSFGSARRQGDADSITPTYDGRELQWQQRFVGTKAQALAGLSAMARHLLRGPGWLRFQLAADIEPIWFRTRWADPGDLSFEYVAANEASDIWTIPVTVPIDAYGYGERVVLVDAQTVANDPTAATNPCRLVLPPITGDAPAALRLQVEFGSAASYPTLIGELQSAGTVRLPVQIPIGAGAGTAGTDTNAGSANPDAISDSVRVVSFATNEDLVTRVYGNTPALAPGRYRAMLRVTAFAVTARFQFAASHPSGTARSPQVTESFDEGGDWRWIDLGVHSMPESIPGSVADYGPDVAVPWSVRVARLAGDQDVSLDHLILIPVDVADTSSAQSFRVEPNFNVDTDRSLLIDGDSESVWPVITATGALMATGGIQPTISGVFPEATPGNAHVLHLIHEQRGDSDNVSRTATLTISYHPRYALAGEL